MKVTDLLTEGPLDYFRGAGQEFKKKLGGIGQQFKDIHQSGQQTSAEAELAKATMKYAKMLMKYYSLKKQLTVSEGVMDYVRGAGQEVGRKLQSVAQPFKDVHQAGRQQSIQGQVQKLRSMLVDQQSVVIQAIRKCGLPDCNAIMKQVLSDNNVPITIRGQIFSQLKAAMKKQPKEHSGPGIPARTANLR